MSPQSEVPPVDSELCSGDRDRGLPAGAKTDRATGVHRSSGRAQPSVRGVAVVAGLFLVYVAALTVIGIASGIRRSFRSLPGR